MTNVYCDFKTYHNGPGSLPYDHSASFYAFPGISATLPRPPKHKVGIIQELKTERSREGRAVVVS